MPIRLSEALHFVSVSRVAADVVFLTQAAAGWQPDGGGALHVMKTLLEFDDPRAHSTVIFRALGQPASEATAPGPSDAERKPSTKATLPQILSAAERQRTATGSPWVTTAHLL